MKNFPNPVPNEMYYLLGYYQAGDEGGGEFYWDPNASGGDNIGIIFTSNVSVNGRWKRLVSDQVNARWFGARGNGNAGEDDTVALQAALDFLSFSPQNRTLYIPGGIYLTSAPLFVSDLTHVTGDVNRKTVIKKMTNTVGSRQVGAVNDSYAVDAIMCITQPSYGPYAYQNTIENIYLAGAAGTKNDYGMFYPRTEHVKLSKVEVENCVHGFYTKDTWQAEHIALVAHKCDFGFIFEPTNQQTGSGTSCTFIRCWADSCRLGGFRLKNLYYTSFSDCAVDHLNSPLDTTIPMPTAYYFEGCSGISLVSCGLENSNCQAIHLKSTKSFSLIGSYHSFQAISTTFTDTNPGLLKFESSIATFSGYQLYAVSLQGTNMLNLFASNSQVTFTNSIYTQPYGNAYVDDNSNLIDLGGTSAQLYNPTYLPVTNLTSSVISRHIRVDDIGVKGLAYLRLPGKAVIRSIRFSALNNTNTNSFSLAVGYNLTDKKNYYGTINWPFPADQYVTIAVPPSKSRKPFSLADAESWLLYVAASSPSLSSGAGIVFEVEYVIEN